jgi:hypothetical protein
MRHIDYILTHQSVSGDAEDHRSADFYSFCRAVGAVSFCPQEFPNANPAGDCSIPMDAAASIASP